jgi:hypothetical protein
MSKAKKAAMVPFDPTQGQKGNKKIPLATVARQVGAVLNMKKPTYNTSKYDDVIKMAWVPTAKCAINYLRQRHPEPVHIAKLVAKWNLNLVTPLQARYSAKDDTYYIADGQQHGIAWVLVFGPNSMVPVCYIESEDESIESEMLLALNNDNAPMAKYFIHEQKCITGDKKALALEAAVRNAGCFTSYKKRSPGAITHITDLNAAEKSYGVKNIEHVLSKMRVYWSSERIYTASMMGFLKLKELMIANKVYSDQLFDDAFNAAHQFFDSSNRLHLDIKDQFKKDHPTNHQGMGLREKIASGIIDAYEKVNGVPFPVAKPFAINMPWIENPAPIEDVDAEDEDAYAFA